MASASEIQNRIKSIRDTMKITRAMYMMSSMKLRKARKQLEDTMPFFDTVRKGIAEMLMHFPDMQHLYFDNRDEDLKEKVKKKGIIVITGDKGMAGAYNHNAMKIAQSMADESEEYTLYVVGELGRHYFASQNYKIDGTFQYSANKPSMHRARVIAERVIDLYNREKLDRIDIVFTQMINSMKSEVRVMQLLPLRTHTFMEHQAQGHENTYSELGYIPKVDNDWYLIYPSPKVVLERMVYDYVTGFTYGALVEGSACEENARMLAMQSATDNAEAMLHDLSIQYNRVRQAAITQEITEVVGGAKALRKNKKKK